MKRFFPSWLLILVSLMSASYAHAQWTLGWTSPSVYSTTAAGWFAFQESGGSWSYRYFTIDSTTFRVMTSPTSAVAQYTYTFLPAEWAAGNVVYSLGVDLTGDGIVEFYILGSYGSASPYRQSMKILDITTGNILLERNSTSYSFGEPSVWDLDGDGLYECAQARADYPSGTHYVYEVYETGVSTGAAARASALPQKLTLRQNYPNPFNPTTRIEYDLERNGRVELEILNMLGERVQMRSQDAGHYAADWDGQDARGVPQASGPYYYQLRLNGAPVQTRQMYLVR
jgi:hypothetical protein